MKQNKYKPVAVVLHPGPFFNKMFPFKWNLHNHFENWFVRNVFFLIFLSLVSVFVPISAIFLSKLWNCCSSEIAWNGFRRKCFEIHPKHTCAILLQHKVNMFPVTESLNVTLPWYIYIKQIFLDEILFFLSFKTKIILSARSVKRSISVTWGGGRSQTWYLSNSLHKHIFKIL